MRYLGWRSRDLTTTGDVTKWNKAEGGGEGSPHIMVLCWEAAFNNLEAAERLMTLKR